MLKFIRWNRACQIWKWGETLILDVPVKGIRIENDYLRLKEDGELKIKPRYTWNGCSPKIEVLGMVLGTPEGALPEMREKETINLNLEHAGYGHLDWCKPKTYYASLVHDCLYQISETEAERMSRKVVDDLFLQLLKAYRFQIAVIYYLAVRIFGRFYWGRFF